ncbi:hypothetical protein EB061_10915 [bacterium]|jgi:hypothetical protein|nr:hypothetical protein [bacterium]
MKYEWAVLAVLAVMAPALGSAQVRDSSQFAKAEPGKTRFEVLRESFDSAPDAAQVADFISPPKTDLLCVGAVPSKPDTLNPYFVRVVQVVLKEAVAGNGPLFPPTKAVIENTVIFGNENTVAKQSAAGFSNRVCNRDFEIHVSSGTYQDVSDSVMVVFRRDRDYLPFKAVRWTEKGVPSEAFLYGYCYFQPHS